MKRRTAIWLLASVFVLGCAVRILHFPFRTRSVLRVIPADALLMSRHVAPEERILEVLKGGFLDPMLVLAGFPDEAPGLDLVEDEGLRWLLGLLGRRYVATAYTLRFGERASPAFVMSAWVGGLFTHLARRGFLDNAFSDFQMVRVDRGTRIWRMFDPDLPEGFRHISFGVYEGVAFGVATDDPLGAMQLYRVMRRHAASAAGDLLEEGSDVLPAGLPDRVRLAGLLDAATHVAWGAPQGGVLEVHLRIPFCPPTAEHVPASLDAWMPVLEPVSALLVGTTAARALDLLGVLPLDPVVQVIGELLYTHGSDRSAERVAMAWVAARSEGGRVLGLRVPAVAFAMETVPGRTAREVLDPILDRLRTGYRLAWQHQPYGERGVLALVPPAGHLYGRLAAGERAGFVVWNGLGILHSSADALDRLVGLLPAQPAQDIRMAAGSSWYLKADMPAVAEVFRVGYSSYVLWSRLEGHVRNPQQEAFLGQMGNVLEAYTLLEGRVTDMAPDRSHAILRLTRRIGEGQ